MVFDGRVLANNEDLQDPANRLLHILSGIDHVYIEQVRTFGEVDHGPYERVVSTTYRALMLRDEYKEELNDKYNAKWFPIDRLPELIFDHRQTITAAIDRLKRRVRVVPIVFKLLPPRFTIPQLHKLFEGILGETIDKCNFRKKAQGYDFFVQTARKRSVRIKKKGAFLHHFDEKI